MSGLRKVPNRFAFHHSEPLDARLRASLEDALDSDLSALRAHTGSLADSLTTVFGAEALTIGSDVYFRRGTYQPSTPEGIRLIAHEAAHVSQQGKASPGNRAPRPLLDMPGDAWERAADSFADAFVAGSPRTPALAATGSVPVIQRHISFEHRWLGDGATSDLALVAAGKADTESKRNEILDNQINLMMLWHDKPAEVDEKRVKALCPWIQTLRIGPEQVLVTYGELNALPDYFANPATIEKLGKRELLPVLQVIRQESYNWLVRLKEHRNPGWTFPDSAAPVHGTGLMAYLGWNDTNDTIDSIAETSDLDNFTRGWGVNGENHYGGLLARNACHFAPYSWRRWSASHLMARSFAEEAFKDAGRREELTRKAWLYHGYADHFLQDSFAAGHLINKTMVMQWWVDWAKKTQLYVENWELIKDMTVGQQPALANVMLYRGFEGPSNDPQTVEEYLSLADRMKFSGVLPYRDDAGLHIDGMTAYQRYLALIGSSVAQVATNALHDVFNNKSVWVASSAKHRGYQVWGDATLFSNSDGYGNEDRFSGVKNTSEAAQLSQLALRQILEKGSTEVTLDAIRDHFPTRAGSTEHSITDIATWNQQQKAFCEENLFKDSMVRFKDAALTALNARLSPVTKDEDLVQWNRSLDGAGYRDTNVLVQDGRLFAASYGFVYEINPMSGEVVQGTAIGARGFDGDYTTTLASDGKNLFCGTHGYVYSLSMQNFGQQWYAGVGEHGYHRVNVTYQGGELYAGCNGHVYRIDHNSGDVRGNLDLGGEDQLFSFNGEYLIAGRTARVYGIAVPNAANRDRFEIAWQRDYEKVAHPETPVASAFVGQRLFIAVNWVEELDPKTGASVRVMGGIGYKANSGEIRFATNGQQLFAGYSDVINAYTVTGGTAWLQKVGSIATDKGINPNSFPVSILCLKDRIYTGSNGYLYEVDPGNGAVRQWIRPTYPFGLGDYDTHLATDGRNIFMGINGFVYKVSLADRSLATDPANPIVDPIITSAA